ncbi:MAG TPA: PadR family transcriptional regulator [Aggregatilineales bacterium]|nr:PadR family transcriptional regulator [Aggregatilineales bacterium]
MYRELLLLGVLRHKQMHGYELHEFINRDLAFCTDIKKPTAYHLLQKMAEQGWITEIPEPNPPTNRPPRTVYQLTEAGEATFLAYLRQNLATYSPSYFNGDVGIAFIEALPSDEACDLLEQRKIALTSALNALNTPHGDAHTKGGMSLIIEHQKRHLSTELAWLDEVINRIRTQP